MSEFLEVAPWIAIAALAVVWVGLRVSRMLDETGRGSRRGR